MSVRLYVGNLSFDATAEDLREIFADAGTVEDAVIVTRPGGGRPRGFGFVTLSDDAEGAEAIRQLDGQPVAGRPLKVNVAKSRDEGDDKDGDDEDGEES
ncbi:MAG: RNA recognition motif-containing protein [Lentimonas sp.]|jgi:RNA recognition motif-containing protein